MSPMSKEHFFQRVSEGYGSKPKGQQGPEFDRRRYNRRPTSKQNGRRPRKGH